MTNQQAHEKILGQELSKNEVGNADVLAIQLEMEQEQLSEWREKRLTVNIREIKAS